MTPPDHPATPGPALRPLRRRVTGSVWFHLVAAFVVAGLVLTFVAKPYWVPSGSMEQTLQPGDRVLVNRLAYVAAAPTSGDIVVFDAGTAWDGVTSRPTDPVRGTLRWVGEVTGFGPSGDHTLVKRIIGTPGQHVACCDADGAVTVDGNALDEPYAFNDPPFEPGTIDCDTTPRSLRCFDEVTVPADAYLMLGDNRGGSSDSVWQCRGVDATAGCWRWAMRDEIVGQASVILWPIGRWAGL